MALKLKLTKDEYNALPDAIKAEYKADGDAYALDVSGIEDTGALRRAHDRTKQELDAAKAERDAMKQKLDSIDTDTARKAGDIATLEKSWKEKTDAEIGKRDSVINNFKTSLANAARESAATKIAAALTDHPAIMLPHIKSRITAEFEGDATTPTVRILGGDGKISAMSVDDLQKEFAGNKDFSAIIRGSKASGGAANAGNKPNGGGAANGGNNGTQPSDLSRMNPKDLAARIQARKESENT